MSSRVDAPDTQADRELRELLDRNELVGFTMVAGAGSGKTTSLVKALAHVTTTRGATLLAQTQRVACITYTEVAAREIHEEIGNDPLASVSTIHSFLWKLVKPFQKDIGVWVQNRIAQKISDLEEKQANYSSRTRPTTKEKDSADLLKLEHQAHAVKSVKRFNYSIGGDYANGTLGHADIVKMAPQMIIERSLLTRLVARQFPFIFVDESQDTYPDVVECLKRVNAVASGKMCLGFFGDPMQQIYAQGVVRIDLEPGWVDIGKPENFRSSRRVLACVNAVRSEGDSLQQVSGLTADAQKEGEAFCFVLPADDTRTANLERVRSWLDANSNSGNWTKSDFDGGAKILMIVHRMAARRLGFDNLYSAFNDNGASGLKDSFDQGSAWPLTPFRDLIVPLCRANDTNSPEVLSVLKEQSPLVRGSRATRQVRTALSESRAAVAGLRSMVAEGPSISLGYVLRFASAQGLVDLDPRMSAHLNPEGPHSAVVLDEKVVATLTAMMDCAFSELAGYYTYINQESPYSTQHGTKGSEFERVVVVLDDDEGRYFQYSYDKLLGIKAPSADDLAKRSEGKDSVIDRTRRLFYVCVSRARESLAIVLFSNDVNRAIEEVRSSVFGEFVDIRMSDDLVVQS